MGGNASILLAMSEPSGCRRSGGGTDGILLAMSEPSGCRRSGGGTDSILLAMSEPSGCRRSGGGTDSILLAEFGSYSLFDNEGEGIGGGIGEGDPRVTVYIQVDDPQAYLDRATQAGATVLMPVTTIMEGTTIALFADPAGNTMGLLKAEPW